ncbi:Uncharacterized conserved protein YbjQ, UPF0145 family [Cohaesibacter marisflavi]|uniref:UPF0145 protein SAMN04488056_1284 n=1 Tax=Cohaesibacter marisflavi TaxID=655353 RepID=A0A1I5NAT8_9HYPH|nr:YbjQ family protein [Cohaesibacter marisflavi]SFP18883.1 Uncharacterized conserved protein YbjQ, UPF0145 family [Cohaesibacter marisflavi]
MAECKVCGKSGLGIFEVKEGKCPDCRRKEEEEKISAKAAKQSEAAEAHKKALGRAQSIWITTEAFVDSPVNRLGVVAGEAVIGMGLFKDIAANFRDVFGGRSKAVQDALSDARNIALNEMKLEAATLGANAVIAVDIDYHSISTGSGLNMMIVACSGTAVAAAEQS